MPIPIAKTSSTYVEAVLIDSYGIVTEVDTLVIENPDAPVSSSQLLLAAGNNTITVPTRARGVIISCDPNCNTFKSLVGVLGVDPGFSIFGPQATNRHTGTILLTFASPPPATFILASSALDTGITQIQFF